VKTLFPHQEDALKYAVTREHVALFMEMRLGKSVVSIRWAKPLLQPAGQGGAMIVAPLSTLKGWERELHDEGETDVVWLTGCSVAERTKRASAPHSWYLINYESLRGWKDGYQIPWSVLILDESTRIRNPKAQITKLVNRRYFDVPHRAILSGLPNPESYRDFFEQMRFISSDGTFMGFSNFWAWQERFFFQVGYDWIPKRKPVSARDKIKQAVRDQAFVLTRKEAGVGSSKVYETRTVKCSPAQRRALHDVKKHFRFDGDRDLETKSAGVQFLWMQRISGGFSPDRDNPEWLDSGKVDELVTLLTGELKNEQVVVWFRFNEELAATYHTLREKGIDAVAITGATDVDKRNVRQLRFQSGDARVICIQVGVGRYGLDLSAADTAIYYSNTYEYEARAQSEDRIVHVRKKQPLLYIDLVTEGTPDEDAVDALRDKDVDARSFMSNFLSRVRSRYGSQGRGRAA
jgi:SNF2 family DNA or RNA helicase